MSREAMQLALAMLNEIADDVYSDQKLEGVITALRQALVDADDTSQKRVDETSKAEHEWVGLTDEEIHDLSYLYQKIDASNSPWFDRCGFARAIEQALKKKNHG
jgi:hypothetical protein